MQRQPVISSNIKSIGLEGKVLEIEFANGSVYQYAGETAAVHHAAMTKAESVGKYFSQNVRNDRALKTTRVGDSKPAEGAAA
jgi:hypothetical protein